jgi:polysaccharide pyruvyl transferase WcaK-like protein
MRVHHFYPRTNNIGDHFVQRGIERMVCRAHPEATFDCFDVNDRGLSRSDYGLTRRTIERANKDADLIIVGGSNLYEGNYRWPWGIHLEPDALQKLRVPLLLLGVGAGSNFRSPLHQPSNRAKKEIRLLNDCARFSGVRDVITLDFLKQLGIAKAELTGDPAAFIFNRPAQCHRDGHVLIAMPPQRFWSNLSQFWTSRVQGRPLFRAMASIAKALLDDGQSVIVCCNDPIDLPVAESLLAGVVDVRCPNTAEEYFQLLKDCRAVITARLHTAVVAFSLGLPFVLVNVDQRTNGFIKTFDLDSWSIVPSSDRIENDLRQQTAKLLRGDSVEAWNALVVARDKLHRRAMMLLEQALV